MRAARSLRCALAVVFFPALSSGVPIASAYSNGPDDREFPINLTFLNEAASSQDVVSIGIDGNTASSFPLLWDSAGTSTAPGGTSLVISGVDSTLLMISFVDATDGFNPGESFSLSFMDPDPVGNPRGAVAIEDLVGVGLTFTFRDASTLVMAFVDDPSDGAGVTTIPNPEPASSVLFLVGSTVVVATLRRGRVLSRG